MKHYCEEVESVVKHVQSTSEGLSTQEAEKRLAANGKNKLAEAKKDSLLKRFISQLMDPMILILLAAAAISGVLAVVEGESFTDVIIILAVVIVNAVLGVRPGDNRYIVNELGVGYRMQQADEEKRL